MFSLRQVVARNRSNMIPTNRSPKPRAFRFLLVLKPRTSPSPPKKKKTCVCSADKVPRILRKSHSKKTVSETVSERDVNADVNADVTGDLQNCTNATFVALVIVDAPLVFFFLSHLNVKTACPQSAESARRLKHGRSTSAAGWIPNLIRTPHPRAVDGSPEQQGAQHKKTNGIPI